MNRPTTWPERNVKLLRETMDFIEKHPDKHNQGSWVNQCGTAFCYAGHAALLAGVAPPSSVKFGYFWMINTATLQSFGVGTFDLMSDASLLPIDAFAIKQLGLTEVEGEVLFDGSRTREELRTLVDAFCAGAWITDVDEEIWLGDGQHYYVHDWLLGDEEGDE